MNFRSDITVFPDGITPEPGVYVTVKDSNGNLVALFDNDAAPLGNPVVSDTNGAFFYGVVDSGTYIEEFRLSPTALPRRVQAVELGGSSIIRITPERYGAVGYPLGSNDGGAIHQAGQAISALGFGVLECYPGRKYIVGGGQALSPGHQSAGYAWPPAYQYVLDIVGCSGPVLINLNGATFKCADSVKYGTFNDDGTSKGTPPGTLTGGLASPYDAMIAVRNCTGLVRILNGELDGNIANVTLGGYYGDNGRQIPYSGIHLTGNAQGPIVDGVNSHHHGEDGILVNGLGLTNVRENGVVKNCQFLNNGRGNSFVGGNGWIFENCWFNETGKDIGSMSYTGPGTGIDLEAEGGRWVKNLTFRSCEFIDNTTMGVNAPVASSGFASNIHFEDCKFVGVDNWACWVYAPYVSYERCLFVGAIVGMYPSSTNPASATKFRRCKFDYNAALTPDGVTKPFTNGGELAVAKYLDFTFGTANIDFDECTVLCSTDTSSPSPAYFGASDTRQINCTFRSENSQKSLAAFGLFEGQRTLFWNVQTFPDQAMATTLFKNYAGPAFDSFQWGDDTHALARYDATGDRETGKKIYSASKTWDPPSVADGSNTTTTLTATGAVVGDKVDTPSFGVSLAGLILSGYVSAADTVTVVLANQTGGAVNLASSTLRVKVRQT